MHPTSLTDRRPEGVDASFGVDQVHRIRFTSRVFDPANPILRDIMALAGAGAKRAMVFIDDGVAAAWGTLPAAIDAYAAAHPDVLDLVAGAEVVAGGERSKNDWGVYHAVMESIERHGLCRHSFVLAIGGGAMLDAVGFAAATAHRGVRLIRFPTTTLAQDDAGIGVKNGINAFGKKNFIGAFGVPWAVINDDAFLATQDDRDWRAGISEAVKVALLRDAPFFEEIAGAASRLRERDHAALVPIVRRSAELHLDHIACGGDPFEVLTARPLDFGHWSAHKLEPMTDYEMRHGEAVAIGIALDCAYSMFAGRLAATDCERIVTCLADIGFDLWHDALAEPELIEGLEEFREHLGGALTITLLNGIGDAVDVHTMDNDLVRQAIGYLRQHGSR